MIDPQVKMSLSAEEASWAPSDLIQIKAKNEEEVKAIISVPLY